MSAGLALSMLQDSAETLAWTVAKEVDAQVKENMAFLQLWDAIKNGKKNQGAKELPLQAMMQELNKVRVSFKHYGVLPEAKESQRYFAYTEEYLRETMLRFFDTKFDEVSLADMVANDEVRNAIKEAEAFLGLGELEKAINASAVAEYLSMRRFDQLLPEFDRGLDRVSNAVPHQYQQLVRGVAEYVENYISALRRMVILGLSGHRLGAYQHFFALTPAVHRSMSGKFSFAIRTWNVRRELSEKEAKFCVEYATEFAISMQERLR